MYYGSGMVCRAVLHVFPSPLVFIVDQQKPSFHTQKLVTPIDAFPCMYHQLVSAVPLHETVVGKAMQYKF